MRLDTKKNWALFFINISQSNIAASLYSIALSFLVLEQTHSAKQMALTFAFSYLPIFLVPFASTWFDLLALKIPLVAVSLLRCAVAVLIIALYNSLNVFWIYFLAFAESALLSIYNPANQAIIPLIFPKSLLSQSNGAYVLIKNGLPALGFFFGGLIVGTLGTKAALIFYALSCFISAGLLLFIKIPRFSPKDDSHAKNFFSNFVLGLKIIGQHRKILFLIISAFCLNTFVFSIFDVLLPFYMTHLGKGANGVGLFNAILGLGIAVGGLGMMFFGKIFKINQGMLLSFIFLAITFFCLTQINTYILTLSFIFIVGILVGIFDCFGLLLVQQNAPLNCMARINGLVFSLVQMGKSIYMFLGASMIAHLTMQNLYWFGLIIAVFSGTLWLTTYDKN